MPHEKFYLVLTVLRLSEPKACYAFLKWRLDTTGSLCLRNKSLHLYCLTVMSVLNAGRHKITDVRQLPTS